jgi:hypothetical protein
MTATAAWKSGRYAHLGWEAKPPRRGPPCTLLGLPAGDCSHDVSRRERRNSSSAQTDIPTPLTMETMLHAVPVATNVGTPAAATTMPHATSTRWMTRNVVRSWSVIFGSQRSISFPRPMLSGMCPRVSIGDATHGSCSHGRCLPAGTVLITSWVLHDAEVVKFAVGSADGQDVARVETVALQLRSGDPRISSVARADVDITDAHA